MRDLKTNPSFFCWLKDKVNQNNKSFGFTIGGLLPIILFLLFCTLHLGIPLNKIDTIAVHLLPKILSLSVFPNGLIFYYYIIKDKELTMRGILTSTLFYGMIMILIWAYIFI